MRAEVRGVRLSRLFGKLILWFFHFLVRLKFGGVLKADVERLKDL